MLNFVIMAGILLCSQKSKSNSVVIDIPKIVNSVKNKESKKHTGKVHKNFTVTAYSNSKAENGGYTITCTGHKLKKGIIAVDPRVIELGSKIYIPGYGEGIADDTGGAIKGRHIDVCLPSRGMVNRWGRRKLTITVIPPEKHHKHKK